MPPHIHPVLTPLSHPFFPLGPNAQLAIHHRYCAIASLRGKACLVTAVELPALSLESSDSPFAAQQGRNGSVGSGGGAAPLTRQSSLLTRHGGGGPALLTLRHAALKQAPSEASSAAALVSSGDGGDGDGGGSDGGDVAVAVAAAAEPKAAPVPTAGWAEAPCENAPTSAGAAGTAGAVGAAAAEAVDAEVTDASLAGTVSHSPTETVLPVTAVAFRRTVTVMPLG